jgi:hypothetical protein
LKESGEKNRGLIFVIICAVIFLLAAAGAGYFLLDGMRAEEAIVSIDEMEYDKLKSEKGAQYSFAGETLSAEVTESLEGSVYHTPLGFSIVSYSSDWTGQKLVEIYNELLRNGHGDEIGYLSEIALYSGKADYSEMMDAAGDRSNADIDSDIYVDIPALIPAKLRYDSDPLVSDIRLYYMDQYDDAADIAKTLAHEYGHHYTIYYFMQDDGAVRSSEYYELRGFKDYDHEIFYHDNSSYYENHMWDVYEIAAEDYVQLLGSPSARLTNTFMDNRDAVDAGVEPGYTLRSEYINVFPQENIFIPLADEIPGLRDYIYSFIGKENEYGAAPETFDFNLQIKGKSYYGYRYYNITWTMPDSNPEALYTLVCYDSSGELYIVVRTVNGGEEAIARVGKIVKKKGNWLRGWDDGVPKEDRIFKLYLLLPDGRMVASEPFYMDF